MKPDSTPKAMVEDLLTMLGERASQHYNTRYKLVDEAARAILGNDIQLLFVDEADQLDQKGFEFLRYIYCKTGCPIVIVGLRTIIPTIDRHEKFNSRIGPRIEFYPPSEEEILKTVLPQLVFPRWSYDPATAEDQALGQQLWAHVKPSFRDLRVVLQYASQVAEMREAPKITPAILKQVYHLVRNPWKSDTSEEETDQVAPPTQYEVESQQRHDAKKGGKRR